MTTTPCNSIPYYCIIHNAIPEKAYFSQSFATPYKYITGGMLLHLSITLDEDFFVVANELVPGHNILTTLLLWLHTQTIDTKYHLCHLSASL